MDSELSYIDYAGSPKTKGESETRPSPDKETPEGNIKRQKHYEQWDIQPVDFIVSTIGPSWLVGNVIKYVMRYNEKNGKEDIHKAIHYCEMLLNHIEGRDPRDYGKET